MRKIILGFVCCYGSTVSGQQVTLAAFGDAAGIAGFGVHGESPVGQIARNLRGVEPLKADINFVNLEASLTRSCQRYMRKPFQFSMGPKTLGQFVDWGFNLFGLANNHTIDCLGPFPANESVRVQSFAQQRSPGIRFHGIAKSLARLQKPAVMNIRGLRIGMVSIKAWANPRSWPLASLANRDLVFAGLRDAQVDVRILSLHGGEERARTPTPLMRQIAREFITEYGGDIVLGHHSHTMQGYEVVTKPSGRLAAIVYSLGNFLHNGLSKKGDGLVAHFSIGRHGIEEMRLVPLAASSYAPRPETLSGQALLQTVLRQNHRYLAACPWPRSFRPWSSEEVQVAKPYPHLRVRLPVAKKQVQSRPQKPRLPADFQTPAGHSLWRLP